LVCLSLERRGSLFAIGCVLLGRSTI